MLPRALRRHAVAADSTPALLPLADKPDRRTAAAAHASRASYFCQKNFSSEQNTCCLHPPASRCHERFRPHARVPQAQHLLPAPWHCPTARAVPCGRLPRPLHPRLTLRRPNGPPVQSTRRTLPLPGTCFQRMRRCRQRSPQQICPGGSRCTVRSARPGAPGTGTLPIRRSGKTAHTAQKTSCQKQGNGISIAIPVKHWRNALVDHPHHARYA